MIISWRGRMKGVLVWLLLISWIQILLLLVMFGVLASILRVREGWSSLVFVMPVVGLWPHKVPVVIEVVIGECCIGDVTKD